MKEQESTAFNTPFGSFLTRTLARPAFLQVPWYVKANRGTRGPNRIAKANSTPWVCWDKQVLLVATQPNFPGRSFAEDATAEYEGPKARLDKRVKEKT